MASTMENLAVVATGVRAGSVTAIALPAIAGRFVTIRAQAGNVGNVYLGMAGVTVPGEATNTTGGYPLDAGEAITLPLSQGLSDIYMICDNAGDDIHYLVEGSRQ